MKANISGTDSLVVFRNSQGLRGRGTLMHLTRSQVVFEVYNPYSVVQLSEVLRDVRIHRGEQTIYRGRAVVSSLVPTGLMVIVSATLVDPWTDLVGLTTGESVQGEVERFVLRWESSHALRPAYRLAVGNLRSFLGELSRWLEQAEVYVAPEDGNRATALYREFVEEAESPLTPKLDELFGRFEKVAAEVPDEEAEVHKTFARRDLHPLTLCSPFIHRCYTKPLGYAGDYTMVNMILDDPLQGANAYAKIINSISLRSGTAIGHRNRIHILTENLKTEARRVAAGERGRLRVLNIGCGPAREVERFIREDPLSERCRLELMDFNEETIAFAKKRLGDVARDADRTIEIEFVHKSIHQLLKEASGRSGPVEENYDFVYCAGLFDYLADRICRHLLRLFYAWTRPGGLVLATNVHVRNPIRYFMEHLMEWYLVLRDEASLMALAPNEGSGRVYSDGTGVNIFLEIRKEVTSR